MTGLASRITAVALSLLVAGTAYTQDRPASHAGGPVVLAQSADVGPAAAAAAARDATGGRVLDVRPAQSGGRVMYRVKVLLPGGRVRTVTVDGASGQVLG